MNKRTAQALRRLEKLEAQAAPDVPAVTVVYQDGAGQWVAQETYNGGKQKRFNLDSPDAYKARGGVVLIDDITE